MEATGNNIYCRFWANLQGGWIKAGVITNIHDTSTFIPLVTVSGSGWNEYEFTTTEVGIDDVYGSHITLFPNPASATVTLTGIEGQATVSVVDMNGRVSGERRVENSLSMSVASPRVPTSSASLASRTPPSASSSSNDDGLAPQQEKPRRMAGLSLLMQEKQLIWRLSSQQLFSWERLSWEQPWGRRLSSPERPSWREQPS